MMKRHRRRCCMRQHLSDLNNGSGFRIKMITGDRDSRNKLYEMGLYPGKTGLVLSRNPDGGIVIVSGDLKLMLSFAFAELVKVC